MKIQILQIIRRTIIIRPAGVKKKIQKTAFFKHFVPDIKHLWLFFLVFLFPIHQYSQNKKAQLIVWNVGQGQMVTYSDLTTCIHFDMGGEKLPLRKLIKECGLKKNQVFFSHWDWDHIRFAKQVWRRIPSVCRLNNPGGIGGKKKQRFLFTVPLCDGDTIETSQKLFKEIAFFKLWNKDKKHTKSNKQSRVAVLKQQVLIPGDSPGSSERFWMGNIKAPINTLILSHHGSRNSTTYELLNCLPHLKIAIASARRKRYGHPHPLVKQRLAKKGVALIGTEEFNHIRLPFPY